MKNEESVLSQELEPILEVTQEDLGRMWATILSIVVIDIGVFIFALGLATVLPVMRSGLAAGWCILAGIIQYVSVTVLSNNNEGDE